jgi:hypothetical protein
MMSGDSVGVLVLAVCSYCVTDGTASTIGFVVCLITSGVVLRVLEDCFAKSKVVEIKLEFLLGTVGIFNVVEVLDNVLVFTMFGDLVIAVSFDIVTTGFSLCEMVRGDTVKGGAVEVVIDFTVVSLTAGLSL